MHTIFLFILTTLCFSYLNAQTLYVLLATDTLSSTKRSSTVDRKRMTKAVQGISLACNMKLKLTTLLGKGLTPKALHKWVRTIDPSNDDVVLFYYSGHGNRHPYKTSRWPSMYLTAKKKHVHLKSMIKTIKKKKARLSLILCDCCNSKRSGPMFQMHVRGVTHAAPINLYQHELQSLNTLFTQKKGIILASGSIAGKEAWDTINGGIFTNAWLFSLQQELGRSHPSWKHVFKKTKKLCKPLQKPQAMISVR